MRTHSLGKSWLELISSMRFAISLFTLLAIASMVGTVMHQNEPYNNYLNQFGPFWFPLFDKLGLYNVYNAGWFLAILVFLVASTSLCVWRNTPKMLREMRRFKERLREESFANFKHHAEFTSRLPAAELAARIGAYLGQCGFQWRSVEQNGATLLAAKAGSWRRIGYIFTHSAIVAICLGGLLDSELPLKLQMALADKHPARGNVRFDDVPPSARLDPGSWSFRGNTLIAEGDSSNITVINSGDGVLIQELPYTLRLNKFHIEHYSTGQPRLFASDVTVTDRDTGQSFDTSIEVNKPLIYKGIAAYQASFDDGGTRLSLRPRDLHGQAALQSIDAHVGGSARFDYGGNAYTLEFTAFRPFNVEDSGAGEAETEVRPLLQRLQERLAASVKSSSKKDLRNVGPSFQYKLRDAAGQAREYHNYMLPLQFDGRWYLMSGVREQPGEPFRYLRLPLDERSTLDELFRLQSALADASLYGEIARRYARSAVAGGGISETMRLRLEQSATKVLQTFGERGFQSVADFLEKAVPEAEREKAAEVYLRILQGVAWEAWQLERQKQALPRLDATPQRAQFVQDALGSISDSFFYGVPAYLQLTSYNEVKASVFQLTRSPGKNIVYAGSLLLVLGVFAMFYVRERRMWVLIKPSGQVLMAMSSSRATLDYDEEFDRHRASVAQLLV